ncbi:MAG: ABC transporter ATP-binding protein [Acidimicrobiales bacterium]
MPAILAARANNLGPFHGPQILIFILLVGGGVFLQRRRAKHRPDAHGRTSSDGPRGVPGEEADITVLGPSARTGAGTSTSEVTLERSLQPEDAPAVAPSRPTRAISFGGDDPGGWAVETHGLTKRFDTNVAVDDVELLVPRGSAFGYLGPNGAGKTTLIRTLLGLTRADSGTMSLLGIPVPHERREALARVGAIVDEPRFHPHLTGRENLRLLAEARGGDSNERIGPSLARVGLAERSDDKVSSYSMGMRQRLGVAACLLADPELLILDEPMNGLDPAGMHEMREMIESLVEEGRTVMLCSHLLDEVERTCDAVAIVDHGRVIRQGTIEDLVQGAGALVVSIECADPAAALRIIEGSDLAADASLTEAGVTVTLRAGSSRAEIEELTRRLVEGGVGVSGIQQVKTSLEDWFLTVTSRLGGER